MGTNANADDSGSPPSGQELPLTGTLRLADLIDQEDILMAQVGVDKGDTKVSLARFQNLPDFKVGLFYAGIGEPDVPVQPRDAGQDAIGLQAGGHFHPV